MTEQTTATKPAPSLLPPQLMAKHIVHYRLSDGEIVAQHIGPSEQQTPTDCGALTIANSTQAISPSLYCVDLGSKTVVEKSATQKTTLRAAALVTHVKTNIAHELARTDYTQLPDAPFTAAQRAAWVTYRQTLRDLSKKNLTGDQQMAAWPTAPDGRTAPKFMPDLPKPVRPAATPAGTSQS